MQLIQDTPSGVSLNKHIKVDPLIALAAQTSVNGTIMLKKFSRQF